MPLGDQFKNEQIVEVTAEDALGYEASITLWGIHAQKV